MAVGILLIALGAIALVFRGFEVTREEKILDVGPIEATAETVETVPIPIWASATAIGVGVLILVAGRTRRA
jgi:hypothetical protein